MKYPIDLGKDGDEMGDCCEVPSGEKDKKYYPCIYLEGKEFKDLPEVGTMVISYKITSKTVSEREDKKRVSVELEVREIKSTEGDEEESEEISPEDALDAIRDSLEEE